MTTTTSFPGSELVPVAEPLFRAGERAALAGFLAGYSGLTRDAYTLDLRMYAAWCARHRLRALIDEPSGGARQRQANVAGLAVAGPAGQRGERGGGEKISGGVVEQLTRQCAWPLTVTTDGPADPGPTWTRLSKPRRVAHGPVVPHAESVTTTVPGCRALTWSGSSPNARSAPGR
jgi:hypothetical protein